jgi:cytoskeleton protein RodZ
VPAPASAPEVPAVMEPVLPPPLLKLRFSGPSWAEVKDAEGKVLHSQHNAAGTEYVIEGTPPFYVVIGDATKTSVEVRGEAYDLAPYSRQNVARFTIN